MHTKRVGETIVVPGYEIEILHARNNRLRYRIKESAKPAPQPPVDKPDSRAIITSAERPRDT